MAPLQQVLCSQSNVPTPPILRQTFSVVALVVCSILLVRYSIFFEEDDCDIVTSIQYKLQCSLADTHKKKQQGQWRRVSSQIFFFFPTTNETKKRKSENSNTTTMVEGFFLLDTTAPAPWFSVCYYIERRHQSSLRLYRDLLWQGKFPWKNDKIQRTEKQEPSSESTLVVEIWIQKQIMKPNS